MSVNLIPPVSLHEIRYNFGKSGDITNNDRYVRDFNQLVDGETFDLLDYAGAAFGLQHEFKERAAGEPKWQADGSVYDLPLDQIDRRADGAIRLDTSDATIWPTPDGTKAVAMRASQRYYDRSPGAIGVNGWFYASEVGSDKLYEADWVLETGDTFPSGSQIWAFVFGYRYGYLDGPRIQYAGQQIADPETNKKYPFKKTFSVDKNYRHCLLNFSLWMPGYGRDQECKGYMHSCTIKRKP